MQEEEKQNHSAGTPPEQPKKHKKEKGKSLLETMREIDAKEAEKEAEAEERRQALLAEREKKEKEEYAKKIQQMIDGKWDPTPVWMHYKDGAMSLEGVRTDKIPADIVKKMEEVKAKIESGEFHPFTGPIKTNDGKEAAKAGEVLKDDQLQTMNYYVDGVIGKVPN